MKNLIKVTTIFILLLSVSCSNPKKEQPIKTTSSNAEALTHGFILLENNCFSCHNVDPKAKNKVAPDMKSVKGAYLKKNESLEEFTRTMTSHVQNPSEENSKMPEAIEQFGLMPKMLFTDSQLKDVATYLFETNIEAENWYENQYPNEQKKHLTKANKNISPKEKGLEYALKTKSILGRNLLGAIKTKGTIG
ncbi:MAG: c-type cytochrome, partial [Urechidicola sp.]|nr:c-type cytochrome [Urechidicola sp.]